MTLQVLPPELLEAPKDKIETREPQPYFKPSSLKDGESEESMGERGEEEEGEC